jgi:kinesin family member 15
LKEVQEIIRKGMDNRKVACTNMNLESSRSHAVFTAFIKTVVAHNDGKKVLRTSRFHIVDLAGSERVKDTNAEG